MPTQHTLSSILDNLTTEQLAREVARLKAENEKLARDAAIASALRAKSAERAAQAETAEEAQPSGRKPRLTTSAPASPEAWARLRARRQDDLTPFEREELALRLEHQALLMNKVPKRKRG